VLPTNDYAERTGNVYVWEGMLAFAKSSTLDTAVCMSAV
jgi:hypothetical protein